MDPKVCGKLLTFHHMGSKVDLEALRDQIPLRQGAGKGPKMGSHEDRNLRRRKSIFGCALWYTGNIWVFIELRGDGGDPRGPHNPSGRARGL